MAAACVGDLYEIVTHGVKGMFAEPGDAAIVEESILNALKVRISAEGFGLKGKDIVNCGFLLKSRAIGSDILAVFRTQAQAKWRRPFRFGSGPGATAQGDAEVKR